MQQRHGLDPRDHQSMNLAVKDGGAIIELDNGFLIVIAQDVESTGWSVGEHVTLHEHPRLSSPYIEIENSNGGLLGGKIVATK